MSARFNLLAFAKKAYILKAVTSHFNFGVDQGVEVAVMSSGLYKRVFHALASTVITNTDFKHLDDAIKSLKLAVDDGKALDIMVSDMKSAINFTESEMSVFETFVVSSLEAAKVLQERYPLDNLSSIGETPSDARFSLALDEVNALFSKEFPVTPDHEGLMALLANEDIRGLLEYANPVSYQSDFETYAHFSTSDTVASGWTAL